MTITGQGFGIDASKVSVDVDGVPCMVEAVSQTEILCLSSKPSEGSPAVAAADGTYPAIDSGYRFRGTVIFFP